MDVNTGQAKNKKPAYIRKYTIPGKSRQLEASVHTSLPPLVTGVVRGHVRVSVERGILWEYSIGPPAPKLCVKLKWWGEKSPGTIFRVPVFTSSSKRKSLGDCTTLAVYQVRSGWPQLRAYIRDTGSLTVQVGLGHMTDESMVIGQAVLPSLTKLSPTSPLTFRSSIVNPKGLCLGKLIITFSMHLLEHKKVSKDFSQPSACDQTGPPEFIVGPSAGKFQTKNSPKPAVFTSASSNDREERQIVSKNKEVSPLESLVQQPSGDVGSDSNQAGTSDVSIGPRQMEVISELIDRGTKLREEMIHSVIDRLPRRDLSQSHQEDQQDTVPVHPLLMAEPAQGVDNKSTGLPSNDNLHELICLGQSSGEEDDDIVVGMDDISLTEPDYPLHNKQLLSRLLYEDPNEPPIVDPRSLSGDTDKNNVVAELADPSSQVVSMDTEPRQNLKDGDTPPDPHNDHTKEFPSSKLTSKLTQGSTQSGPSLTPLSSYLGSGERSLESAILRALGMEKLTSLGRVSRARVCVESLEVERTLVDRVFSQTQNRGNKQRTQMRSLIPLSNKSSTYFVEYQFPVALNGVSKSHSSTRLPAAHEVMRVASKKLMNNAVSFNHQSVFPVSFDSSVIQRWWNSTLIFRVYCKRLTERMPFLVGKAVVPLRTCLSSSSLDMHARLEVRSSTLTDSVKDHVTDKDPLIGHLQVLIQLVTSDKKAPRPKSPTLLTAHPDPPLPSREGEGGPSVEPTVKLKEPKPLVQTITSTPPLLQLLLLIPEATDISVSHMEGRGGFTQSQLEPSQRGVPNCYIVCRVFCAKPHPRSTVQWATHNPQFGFKQIYPLYLTPALLEQVCSNFTVIEVWHRTPGPTTEDELIGLVKVSLHQFHLAFSDKHTEELYQEAKLPVVTMDSYCPIVNPFSGNVSGHLAVLCALGTNDQITLLQQQFVCGSYSLHKPHMKPNHHQLIIHADTPPLSGIHSLLAHMFHVTVEGVRNLSAFNNTVWGETDCFVQYHFPSHLPDSGDESDIETLALQPCRTETTLCVSSPSFTHSTQHTLTLAQGVPIQQELVRVCGQGHRKTGHGLSGGVPFELWRRFYYPNIRDQLIAKTMLPIVKLCAMVSMGKGSSASTQTFSLPLKLISESDNEDTREGGLLDVTVSYKAVSNSSEVVQLPEMDEQLEEEKNMSPELEEKEEVMSTQTKESGNDTDSQSSSEQVQSLDSTEQLLEKPEKMKQIPQDAFEARLVIHSALHLELGRAVSPSVYVTLHPHPNVDKVCTPPVPCDQKPAWDHHCVTYIPNLYLQSQCSGLELQVWNTKSPNFSSPHMGGSQDDLYIGCVYVDLSPLGFGLRQISGWYNIVDFGGEVKGQLKVTVSPTERISYPSRLLSYQLESPPTSFIGKANLLERHPTQSVGKKQGVNSSLSEPSVSRTTSMLYQQLRENIQELDDIHKSLQAKLGEFESSAPPPLHSIAHAQSATHPPHISHPPQTVTSTNAPTRNTQTEYTSLTTPVETTEQHRSIEDKESVTREGFATPPPLGHTTPETVSPVDRPTLEHTGKQYYQVPGSFSHSYQADEELGSSLTSQSESEHDGMEAFVEKSASLTDVSLTGENTSNISQHSTALSTSSHHSNNECVIRPFPLNSHTQSDPSLERSLADTVGSHPPHTVELPQDVYHQDSVHDTIIDAQPPTSLPPPTHIILSPPPSFACPPPSSTTLPSSPLTTNQSPPPLSETQHISPSNISSSLHQQQSKPASSLVHQFGQLPNFFMPPEELEESMRRLRTSALSRPAPRTRPTAHKEDQRVSSGLQGAGSTHALCTLQEVQKYLDSRRTQRQTSESRPHMADSNETQRIAKIFSSRSSLSSTEN